MGKAAKGRRSIARKRAKAAKKEAKRQLYKSYGEKGRSRKKDGSGRQVSLRRHPEKPCGNPGCNGCYPQYKRVSVPT